MVKETRSCWDTSRIRMDDMIVGDSTRHIYQLCCSKPDIWFYCEGISPITDQFYVKCHCCNRVSKPTTSSWYEAYALWNREFDTCKYRQNEEEMKNAIISINESVMRVSLANSLTKLLNRMIKREMYLQTKMLSCNIKFAEPEVMEKLGEVLDDGHE